MAKPEQEYDVIVVGGGVNGLGTAAYLQKAGLKVAVFESRDEAGTFCSTEEVLHPGVRASLHACWIVPHWGPVLLDLELEKFGLELLAPPKQEYGFFIPFKDGDAFLASSVEYRKTYEAWKRISEKDAETFREIAKFFAPMLEDFLTMFLYEPATDESFGTFLEYFGDMPVLPKDYIFMTGIELIESLFEHPKIKAGVAGYSQIAGGGLNHRISGPLTVLLFLGFLTAQGGFTCRGGSHNYVHSLVRCFLHHGGQIFYHCPVEKIIIENNEAKGIALSKEAIYPEAEFKARKAVVSDVSAKPTFLGLVGEDKLPATAVAALQHFDYRGATLFSNFWVLNELPEWACAKKFPEVNNTWTFCFGCDSIDDVMRMLDDTDVRDRNPDPPVVCALSQNFGLADPSQAPPGQYPVQAWANVAYDLRPQGGPQVWDAIREGYGDKVEDLLSEYMPNLKKAKIARYCMSPYDYVRKNPHCMGDMHPSGAMGEHQFWSWKPFPGCGAPRTPIAKLYICQSLSTWGYTMLGAAYQAAGAVAEDYGVREQDWWVHKPFQSVRHIMKKTLGVDWELGID